MDLYVMSRLLLGLLLVVPATTPVSGQVATVEPDTLEEPRHHDPDDVRGAARAAQADFERTRRRHARIGFGGGGGSCDEYVGRFCTSYSEGEWYPRDEPEGVVDARRELLERLDSLQRLAPGDGWITGQRVWYRMEEGDRAGALAAARDCGSTEPGWCWALEGLALHGMGRFESARVVFEFALDEMDPRTAQEWRVPDRAVDREARELLDDWYEAGAEVLARGVAALWTLADPLYLVDGNDRLTAHYARWTTSEIRRDARNPYQLSWADDLEELTVRHGWEIGYELTRGTLGWGRDGTIGHKHPEGRDFMPSGRALADPGDAAPEDLRADRTQPRSLYAPPYAPLLLPTEPQVAVFPRPNEAVVVATAYLPEDTTVHADHTHPRPWLKPGDQADLPDRIGLFAVPSGGLATVADTAASVSEGALLLELTPGDYVLSAEAWSPSRRRAGRHRRGVRVPGVTRDIATTSDLLLLRGGVSRPASLEEAVPRALVRTRIGPDDPVAVAWELSGLGFRSETLEYAVSVARTDRGVLRRIGEFFGLAERPRPLALSWKEAAPEAPGTQFRHLDLDLPTLDPGTYRITLTLRTRGRSDVVVTRDFEVVEEA